MDCFANEAVKELKGHIKGHIEYQAQHLQPVKFIAKEQNVLPTPGKGFTADNLSENKELMIKLQQAMIQLDAYEKIR